MKTALKYFKETCETIEKEGLTKDDIENIHQGHIMKGVESQKKLDTDEAENINQGHITKCIGCQESLDTA